MKRLLLLVLAASPALAQERPAVLPLRDVIVDYRVAGQTTRAVPGGIPSTVRLSWNAATRRLRVEPAGRTQVLLLDLGARTVEMMDSGLRTALSLPVRAKDLDPLTLAGAHLVRRGREVVAGVACTDYDVQSSRGHGTVCLTPDGVALRAEGEVNGQQGSFTAISVEYGPVAPSAVQVPPGYSQFDLSRFGKVP